MLKREVEWDALELYGEAEGSGDAGIKKYLNELYWEQGATSTEIGKKYGVNKDTVLTLMRKVGVPAKAPKGGVYFKDALKACGYTDANDFFTGNAMKTKSEMATDLGVSYGTLSTHYSSWVDSFE